MLQYDKTGVAVYAALALSPWLYNEQRINTLPIFKNMTFLTHTFSHFRAMGAQSCVPGLEVWVLPNVFAAISGPGILSMTPAWQGLRSKLVLQNLISLSVISMEYSLSSEHTD